jgi:hypothetical protein
MREKRIKQITVTYLNSKSSTIPGMRFRLPV